MHTMKGKLTKGLMVAVALAGLGFASTARAEKACEAAIQDIQKTLGFVPQFFTKFPESALPGAWEEMKTLQLNPHTALPGKTKELIGLGVAAQIPCKYCIFAHTEFAKLNGASDAEIAMRSRRRRRRVTGARSSTASRPTSRSSAVRSPRSSRT
jgi:AhpD family alkylhydroperoxidase